MRERETEREVKERERERYRVRERETDREVKEREIEIKREREVKERERGREIWREGGKRKREKHVLSNNFVSFSFNVKVFPRTLPIPFQCPQRKMKSKQFFMKSVWLAKRSQHPGF